jgi:hypothetical protein
MTIFTLQRTCSISSWRWLNNNDDYGEYDEYIDNHDNDIEDDDDDDDVDDDTFLIIIVIIIIIIIIFIIIIIIIISIIIDQASDDAAKARVRANGLTLEVENQKFNEHKMKV